MARAVGDIADLLRIGLPVRTRANLIKQTANSVHHIDIAALRIAADIIGLARRGVLEHQPDGAGVIIDKQPIAHIGALPVDRQSLARQSFQYHQRDQLFGEVVGAVIIGTIGHGDRQAIGMPPRLHQMVRSRFGGRIGRARIIGRCLGKQALIAQCPEHFVGRDMMEAECVAPFARKPVPMVAGGLQQGVGAHKIGFDKGLRPVNRPVDMGFCGQMHHNIGVNSRKNTRHRFRVTNIGFGETITRIR